MKRKRSFRLIVDETPDISPLPPIPLIPDTSETTPYPLDALGPLAHAVAEVANNVKTPVGVAANSALAVASLAAQGQINVQTFSTPRPVSLWFLTIAKSGERKSTSDELFSSPIYSHEQILAKQYKASMAKYRQDHGRWRKQIEMDGSSEPLPPEPIKPQIPSIVVADATFEGLIKMLEYAQPSLGMFTDEGGTFVGGYAMNKDNSLKTTSALNGLWQGTSVRRSRSGDGQSNISDRRLSLHLMMQPGVADRLLANNETVDNGFLSRILITKPQSLIGTRKTNQFQVEYHELYKFNDRIEAALDLPLPINRENGGLTPKVVALSPKAMSELLEYQNRIEVLQAPGQTLSNYTSIASKSAEQAVRLAAVLAFMADFEIDEISAEFMQNGIRLAEFYLKEAVRLLAPYVIDQLTKDSIELLKWAHSHTYQEHIHPQLVQQNGPYRFRKDNKRIREILENLEAHHWLHKLPSGTLVGGKNRPESWKVIFPPA